VSITRYASQKINGEPDTEISMPDEQMNNFLSLKEAIPTNELTKTPPENRSTTTLAWIV